MIKAQALYFSRKNMTIFFRIHNRLRITFPGLHILLALFLMLQIGILITTCSFIVKHSLLTYLMLVTSYVTGMVIANIHIAKLYLHSWKRYWLLGHKCSRYSPRLNIFLVLLTNLSHVVLAIHYFWQAVSHMVSGQTFHQVLTILLLFAAFSIFYYWLNLWQLARRV